MEFDSLYAKAMELSSVDLDSTEVIGVLLLARSLQERDYEFAGKGAFLIASVNDVKKKVLNAGMRYYEALQYLRKADNEDLELMISILISLGRVNGLAGRSSEAINNYNEALSLCGDCRVKSLIIFNIGHRFYKMQAYDSAIVKLFDAYELSLDQKNYKRAANCLNYIGLCNHYNKNYDLAREYYFKILNAEGYLIDQFDESAAWAWHNIGFSYFEEGNLERALEYYDRALLIERTLSDSSQQFPTLRDIGEIKLKQEKIDESIIYLEKAAKIYDLTYHTPETFKIYDFLEVAYSKKDPVKHRLYLNRMKDEYDSYIIRMESLRKENLAFEMERLQDQVIERIQQYERIEKWMSRVYLIAPLMIFISLVIFHFYKRKQKRKHREILKLISEV